MVALPYIQLYVADYLADTAHLTAAEHGAYLLLIFNYWQRGHPLNNANERLTNVARMSNDEWANAKPVIQEFFDVEGDTWTHRRIEHDLEAVRAKSTKASNAGKASAHLRGNGRSTDVQRTFNGRSTDVERTLNHTDTDTDTDIKKEISKDISKKRNSKKPDLPVLPGFEKFWGIYPKQRAGNREKALAAYQKAVQRGNEELLIIAGCVAYADSLEVFEGFAKGAAAWLNDDRFLNDYSEGKSGKIVRRSGAAPTKTDRLNAAVQRAVANSANFPGFGGQGEPCADPRPMLSGPQPVRQGTGTDRSGDCPAPNGVVGLFD